MPDFRPTLILRAALAFCVLSATCLPAARLTAQQIADPANLTGEHVSPPALADTLPINHGAPALQQLLMKLRTRASMMLIVAHPDDEDGGFLTYESRGQGARVAMLTLNRGEGGQNLMSADFDGALGLIRTQELLAAGGYMGVDQFFGTEVDFGFSKTKEEAFAKWTHDRVLYDAVRCVRLYRPLVIASVFVGGVTDGHGQHQVSGEIAQEVFTAAADPKVFPEMGLPPWAALKVYARVPFSRVTAQGMFDYATGKWSPPVFHNYVSGKDIDHEPTATVTIHEGDKSALIGMNGDSYVQFARKGLALQKSQNGGLGRGPGGPGGVVDVGYTLMSSRVAAQKATEESVFDGIDTSFAGMATLAPHAPAKLGEVLQIVERNLEKAQKAFDPAHLEATAEPLRDALQTLDSIIAGTESAKSDAIEKFNLLHELRVKRVQLNNALVLALGVTAETLQVNVDARLTPGGPANFRQIIHTRKQSEPIADLKVELETPSGTIKPSDVSAGNTEASYGLVLPQNTPYTQPYFSQKNVEQPFYDSTSQALRNAPQTPAPFVGVAHFTSGGLPLEVRSIAANGVEGSVIQVAAVVPRLSVSVAPTMQVASTEVANRKPLNFMVNVRSNVPSIAAKVELAVPAGWKVTTANANFALTHIDDAHSVAVSVMPMSISTRRATSTQRNMRAFVIDPRIRDKAGIDLGYRLIGYHGLTTTNLYSPADVRVTVVDVTTAPGLKVGYLSGTGDSVPDFLPNLGVTPTMIGVADVTAEKLAKFDVLILGVRAYAAHAELAGVGSRPILNFAKNGGVVIVQYNNGKYGEAEAPYPISTVGSSGDHAHDVVDETMPVVVLEPKAPLLTWPNKITSADFNNWVDERGHAFAGTWSKDFTALLETHDPGQEPQKGGLLVAPVGKGAYIYCGLALYRQLPEGVPGAYRLLANVLSYAKNPAR